jgi:hypothetical protein
MAIYRWDRDPTLGFPPKITIRDRNYRSRAALEAFKERVIADALKRHRQQKERTEANG